MDLQALARRLILAVVLGDLDMHAKNLSLLHPTPSEVALAPAYDVVPHAHLDPAGDMALAVDGQYLHKAITATHLVNELNAWGMRRAHNVVSDTLDEILSVLDTERPHINAGPRLHESVCGTALSLREGRAVGG